MAQSRERKSEDPLADLFEEVAPQVRALKEVPRDDKEPAVRLFEQTVVAIARRYFMQQQFQVESPETTNAARRLFILSTGGVQEASSPEELDFMIKTFGAKALEERKQGLKELFGMVSESVTELDYFIDPERSIRALGILEDAVLYLADANFTPSSGDVKLARPEAVYLPTRGSRIEVHYRSGLDFLAQSLGAVNIPSGQAHFSKAGAKVFPSK